ncbi:ThuA domain-containing protein [Novosphingobium album (ex Hu et al. 2023)]|uniref:ThuA domain-containing protein n=1 Tax=Novosphingobium album (ex Hu et al. 2023) TaxID=2930093 RepID=A0ABT0B1G2_9SPHN|nr:ThuA domain-containing protein [Novosphingobium album (ex Hu et al. 2023)]MCJ2178768.1 ThuA domain-containing protein [Novosphingobium album (ex Hu et al. 2023)]
MPIIRHRAPLQCLVAVRGHPFDRTAFDAMFQAMDGISATMVDQPVAARLMNPDGMRGFDVLVLYDMPGLDFEAEEGAPVYLEPPQDLALGMAALFEAGKGVVALHHALAGWPTWGAYHEWLGGQFLYHPGMVRGVPVPDSGYAHDVTYEAEVLAEHPVTAGLPKRFTLTDEPYLAQVFADDVTPLLRAGMPFTREHFYSAELAVQGRMYARDGWDHPPGSDLIGWTRQVANSRLVYLQPGDGASAYDNPNYRRLVENAVRWTAPPT